MHDTSASCYRATTSPELDAVCSGELTAWWPDAIVKGSPKMPARSLKGMNVLLFLTDQERAIQHFPPGWAANNLPGDRFLKEHGLAFENAFCNACMCSPSRATLMSGYFPAQTGVKWTLEQDMSPPANPQQTLPTDLANLATVMTAAGYSATYKGKFHVTKPANRNGMYVPADLAQYGFNRWNPPDAGEDQSAPQYGGGFANNDSRYINGTGPVEYGQEGILAFLETDPAANGPFFLVASLVNPHDVLAYPRSAFGYGYDPSDLVGDIERPETADENLDTKPKVQEQFLKLTNLGLGKLDPVEQRNYLNFYGNLMKESDAYLVQVLESLKRHGQLENTLIIKTSDHGEMGMTHGGQRQKCFNFYEETMRIPLIYSNPKLFPEPEVSQAMVSHVDLLPTLASLVEAPTSARAPWQGVDYSASVLDPASKPPQDYVVFTFDDYQSGQANGPYPGPMNHIVSIREERYKLAKYYDPDHTHHYEWEMYDLENDPLEVRNIASNAHKRTPHEEAEFLRLQGKLAEVEATRLQPLASA